MFFSKAKYLQSEIERLRAENRTLLCCLLERSGHREAAHLLRGNEIPGLNEEQIKKLAKAKNEAIATNPVVRGWRAMVRAAQNASKPIESHDSAEKLQAKVEEIRNASS